jgi:hypothetical protein
MQKYCEPYFTAVERWRHYAAANLINNRVQLLETAERILSEYSQNPDVYEFSLMYEHSEVELLPEVEPIAGKAFVFGGDKEAFEASRKLVPPELFNRIGMFLQVGLLKSIAGFNDTYLATCNQETRKTVIDCLERIFRLPEEAGTVKFLFREVVKANDGDNHDEPVPSAKFKVYPTSTMSGDGKSFVHYLLQSQASHNNNEGESPNKQRNTGQKYQEFKDTLSPRSPKVQSKNNSPQKKANSTSSSPQKATTSRKRSSSSATKSSSTSEKPRKRQKTTSAKKINQQKENSKAEINKPKLRKASKRVSYRETNGHEEEVASEYEEDNLEDDVEEEVEVEKEKSTDEEEPEWITADHPIIGKHVANIFQVSDDENPSAHPKKSKIFYGTVTKYAPPSKPKKKDQLYHIQWEDGDEQDFDEQEYLTALDIYEINSKWITDPAHPMIGWKVANYFVLPHQKLGTDYTLFEGKVIKYCPATNPKKRDQLYHILWEDGDEEDYDESQLISGRQIYDENYLGISSKREPTTSSSSSLPNNNKTRNSSSSQPQKNYISREQSLSSPPLTESLLKWTMDHDSIGTKVAKYRNPKQKVLSNRNIVFGKVMKYAPETKKNEDDQLYHIQWENAHGDEEDYDEKEYVKGLKLYAAMMSHNERKTSSSGGLHEKKTRPNKLGGDDTHVIEFNDDQEEENGRRYHNHNDNKKRKEVVTEENEDEFDDDCEIEITRKSPLPVRKQPPQPQLQKIVIHSPKTREEEQEEAEAEEEINDLDQKDASSVNEVTILDELEEQEKRYFHKNERLNAPTETETMEIDQVVPKSTFSLDPKIHDQQQPMERVHRPEEEVEVMEIGNNLKETAEQDKEVIVLI